MSARPGNLHTSRSFTRLESTPKPSLPRGRANTLQGPNAPSVLDPLKTNMLPEEDETADVFSQKHGDDDDDDDGDEDDDEGEDEPQLRAPDAFEELPIEIRSLTERYDPWLLPHSLLGTNTVLTWY